VLFLRVEEVIEQGGYQGQVLCGEDVKVKVIGAV
jgi:hypothetical protein